MEARSGSEGETEEGKLGCGRERTKLVDGGKPSNEKAEGDEEERVGDATERNLMSLLVIAK